MCLQFMEYFARLSEIPWASEGAPPRDFRFALMVSLTEVHVVPPRNAYLIGSQKSEAEYQLWRFLLCRKKWLSLYLLWCYWSSCSLLYAPKFLALVAWCLKDWPILDSLCTCIRFCSLISLDTHWEKRDVCDVSAWCSSVCFIISCGFFFIT